MNCPKCGNALITGLEKCVCCGTPIDENGQVINIEEYPKDILQINKNKNAHRTGDILASFSNLPKMLHRSLNNPGELLRELVINHDRQTSVITSVFVLIGAFLCGVCCCTGVIRGIFSMLNIILGAKANTATPQGISYIADRIRMSCGGTAMLCQALITLLTTTVYLVYICKICRVQFTWELAINFLNVIYLTLIPCQLLAILFSLWTPLISLLFLLIALAITHAQACSMLSLITSIPEKHLFRGKLCCIGIALLLTFFVCVLVAPALLGTAWRRVVVLISGMIGSM